MISYYGHSDVGRQRKQNEDSIFTSEGLFVVCDGMGGHKAGEVASQLAIETIQRQVDASKGANAGDPYGLRTAIREANLAIRRLARDSNEHLGMGTTVAAVVFEKQTAEAIYANVGDSRIYLFRDGAIVQLSRDDSWLNAAFGDDAADSASRSELQHVLTKALGSGDEVDFEIRRETLRNGDVLLLCSDGLTTMVPDGKLLDIVSARSGDLEGAAQDLIAAANAAGGRDNISAVLVRYGG